MAIIQQCCCCWTLRQGCYASATFSLIYFFLFTLITGSLTIGRFQQFFTDPEKYENGSETQAENMSAYMFEQRHVISRASAVTAAPSSSIGNESSLGNNITKKIPLAFETTMQLEPDRENKSTSMLRLFFFSEEYSIIQTVNLFLDLLCEVVGVYASILLIRGLQQEKKSWLWPWMIVVPTHIAIDACTIFTILMEYEFQPIEAHLSMVVGTIIVDITLNSINAYGLVCVISQYQEYNAGRGTAAYNDFSSQTPAIMLESATSAKAVLNKPLAVSGSHNRRKSTKDYSSSRSYNDKSDTYCEEFSLQTLATTSDKRKAPDATKNSNVTMGMKNGKITNGLQVIVSSDEGSNTQTVLKENSTSCVTEVTVSQHSNLDLQNKGSIKYGKYLDLKNLPKDNNLKIDNVTDSTPISNIDRVNLMSSKGNGWRKDQIEITMNKSDSDSEDADVLSAFGISST